MTTSTGVVIAQGNTPSRQASPQPAATPDVCPLPGASVSGVPVPLNTSIPAGTERLTRFDPPLDLPVVPKHRRLQGQEAHEFQTKVVAAYKERKAAIKDICAATTRSYGAIHSLLKRCEVQLRCRGAERRHHEVPS
ncbi:helix-turn-helix domain-containing protein [Streptomyces sp. NPDC058371]|uniref:helix-turn-helix domain-containing protein n=1 Tax=Streptomyces sp. NPDC058371 TaxID=3346463 RepID=UPI0036470597